MKEKTELLISIKDLEVNFTTITNQTIYAVNSITLDIFKDQTLAIVGESGSGKTQFALSILNLLASNAKTKGEINFENKNILKLSFNELNNIRGNKISMIFQDSMTSLNPYLRISTQMIEVLTIKKGFTEKEARKKSIELLEELSISEPEKRIGLYPHQFSGGMRQRIMIAIALLANPSLLIADEPTTALDVTIQAQILILLKKLKEQFKISILLITHDMGIVSNIADKIAVFYGGKMVEYGNKEEILKSPKHPYTYVLLKSIPKLSQSKSEKLFLIEGTPKALYNKPENYCVFKDRCPFVMPICSTQEPKYKSFSDTHKAACFKDFNI